MSLWYKQKKRAMKEAVIQAAREYSGKENPSKEDILEILFSEDQSNEFYVYWWENPWEEETKWWQRLNKLWFIPVFICVIMPYQWLVRGKVGFNEKTRLGEFILKMIGEK